MKRALIWSLLGLVPILGATAFFVFKSESSPPPITLSDGSRMTLKKVTHGEHHRITVGSAWDQVVLTCLPRSLLKKETNRTTTTYSFRTLKGKRIEKTPPPKSLLVWLEHSTSNTAKYYQWGQGYSATILSEDGSESGFINNDIIASRGEFLVAWNVTAFPRREKNFTLQIYDGGAVVARWPIKNPYPLARNEKWQDKGLPQTVTNGDLVVTLQTVQPGTFATNPLAPRWQTKIGLNFQHRNPAQQDCWQPMRFIFADASGNCFTNLMKHQLGYFKSHDYALGGTLPLNETWKITVDFMAREKAEVDPADILDLHTVPFGNSTNSQPFATFTRLGSTISFFTQRENRFPPPSAQGRRFGPVNPLQIVASVSPPNPEISVAFLHVEADGVPELFFGMGYSHGFEKYMITPLPKNNRHNWETNGEPATLKVKVAIYRRPSFEFLVRPEKRAL